MDSPVLNAVLGLHAASSWMLTGLIWTVQLVHYPLFAQVGSDAFRVYEQQHTRRITWLVGPLMGLETAAAVALLLLLEEPAPRFLAGAGAVLLLAIWGSTALLQVPCHARLSRGFDAQAWRRLVVTNWIRTAAWSVRGILAFTLLWVSG